MPDLPLHPRVKAGSDDRHPPRLIVDHANSPMRLARRDWSNVVFSVAFCEEARRDFERRNPG